MRRSDVGRAWTWLAGIVAIGFGLLTISEGGAVLFWSEDAQRSAGHYVPFVVWFNFLAGFAYVTCGIGLLARQSWASTLALAIAGATLAIFAAFGVYVLGGGEYEMRTVIAMSLRSGVWVAISAIEHRLTRLREA